MEFVIHIDMEGGKKLTVVRLRPSRGWGKLTPPLEAMPGARLCPGEASAGVS